MSDLTKQEFLAKYGEKTVTWVKDEQRYTVARGSFYASVFEGRWYSDGDVYDIVVYCPSTEWPIPANQPTLVKELDICDGVVYIHGFYIVDFCIVDQYQAD